MKGVMDEGRRRRRRSEEKKEVTTSTGTETGKKLSTMAAKIGKR